MIGLRLTFTAGRYHATGWDHHVNEGVAEWPPAPWRILRALVAASYRLDAAQRNGVERLVERLTSPPLYHLPPATTAHLRHYMPTDSSSVKVLDSFVVVGAGAREPGDVLVWWPEVELAPEEYSLLERLSEQVGYLGRAESWVEIDVVQHVDVRPNAAPQEARSTGAVADNVRLLAAQSPADLEAWRARWLASSALKGKRRPRVPVSVWEALNVETGKLRKDGWSQAPGSRWVEYELCETPRVRPRVRSIARSGPQGVLFLLDGPVLPDIDQTLVVAERFRSAALGRRRERTEPSHWQLSGKGEDGKPCEGHEHAYFLPLAKEVKGRELIDRVLVWARTGLEPEAWLRLEGLGTKSRRLYGGSGHALRMIIADYGDAEQLEPSLGQELLGPAQTWVSTTPFVAPRYTKVRRGETIDSPIDQLNKLCLEVLGARVDRIERLPDQGKAFGWNRYVRTRKKDRARIPPRPGAGFEVVFREPVRGPIALGYGAHFGLGRFRPKAE